MMQTKLDCLPCFLKQTIIALSQNGGQSGDHMHIIREVLAVIREMDISRPPAYTTTFIHRAIRNGLGFDPFSEVKRLYNDRAMSLYPALKENILRSPDPLWTAARLAIAGNIIDFGIFTSIDIESSVRRSLESDIPVDDYREFRESLLSVSEVLYLLDNSGEIVFDMLLIEQLVAMQKRVTAVVKGAPVLNDVTREDAFMINLPGVCRVLENGSDAVGTIIEWTSPEFQKEFHSADLILSKGQANFETLQGCRENTYYLFQSKCGVVSDELGLPRGSMILSKSSIARPDA